MLFKKTERPIIPQYNSFSITSFQPTLHLESGLSPLWHKAPDFKNNAKSSEVDKGDANHGRYRFRLSVAVASAPDGYQAYGRGTRRSGKSTLCSCNLPTCLVRQTVMTDDDFTVCDFMPNGDNTTAVAANPTDNFDRTIESVCVSLWRSE